MGDEEEEEEFIQNRTCAKRDSGAEEGGLEEGGVEEGRVGILA